MPAPARRVWRAAALEVADLRCWRRARIELPEGLVVVSGPNGAGKTSLVEALVLATMGVSPRTAQLAELVRDGAPAVHVAADVTGPGTSGIPSTRELGYAAGIGRRLVADGEPVRQLLRWRLPGSVLVFAPEELRAVKGPPAARRRALDRLLEAVDPAVALDLLEHQRLLAQRNALLRRIRAGESPVSALGPWDAQLAPVAARITLARRREVAALSAPFARWLRDLGGEEGGMLALESSQSVEGDPDEAALAEALAARMAGMRPREVAAGMTLGGPHRDDVWIGTEGHDLRRLGSQGEQRTAALAMLLAHRERLRDGGTTPIMLLDDVLSELDPDRRAALLAAVDDGSGQVLITSAEPEGQSVMGARSATVIRVREGRVAATASLPA
ncbi:MAG: DNA replication and repair protein RecF [Thermoleophilia bacterium]